MYIAHFIYFSVGRHLTYFHLLAIVSHAVLNTDRQVSVWNLLSGLLEAYLERELRIMCLLIVCLTFGGVFKLLNSCTEGTNGNCLNGPFILFREYFLSNGLP